MTSDSVTPARGNEFKARLKTFRNYSNDRVLTNYEEQDPGSYRMAYVPPRGTALKLDWNTISAYCMSAGYVGRFEDGVLQNLYRFDRNIGYYIQCSTDSLVWHLMNVLRTYFPDCTVPATFFSLVENNVLPCLPDIDKLTDSSPEFEAVRAYYVDRELVPFKNGIYSLQDNVLLPRTSFIFVDHPLDVDFDPSALENDIADRFMEMMCNNSDLFELLFEQIGYALYARSFIVPTVTIFYGAGANGKSIVLDLVKRIVGSNNISTLSMYDMTNAFSLASSEGKLLNLSTDSSAGPGDTMIATANTAEFMKKATSGEAFSFNPKHSKPRIGYGPRKFMFATNVMLKFGGIDEGLARRIYAVPFNAKFEEDYSMKVKLTSESTKTWFAMQALISLEEMIFRRMGNAMFTSSELSGEYLICKASEEMKVEQLAAQDTVLDWLADELDLDIMNPEEINMALVGQETLYESYCYFCGSTRRPSKSRRGFHSTLKARYGITFRRTSKPGGTHVWVASRDKTSSLQL